MERSELSNFRIGGPKLQNGENRGTKTASKPKLNMFGSTFKLPKCFS